MDTLQGDANDQPVAERVEDKFEDEQENNETADEIDDAMVRVPNIQTTGET